MPMNPAAPVTRTGPGTIILSRVTSIGLAPVCSAGAAWCNIKRKMPIAPQNQAHQAKQARETRPSCARRQAASDPSGRMNEMVDEAAALRRWLLLDALPLWWEVGADRSRGGFYE